MKCPKCSDARTYVSTSKPHESGGVYRYRRCSGCDYHFTTMETVYDADPKRGRVPTPERPVPAPPKPEIPKPESANAEKPAQLPKLKKTVLKKDAVLIKKIRREVRSRFDDLAGEEDDWYA